MSFQPVVPMGGLGGWRFLQRTYDQQFANFTASQGVQRDTAYFRENIGKVETAEDLVSDRRLMRVALGAFGLQEDIDNRYFIRKVLEEGTTDKKALANRFADERYKELSQAFGFGPGEFLKVGTPAFVDTIVNRFETGSFESATGEQNPSLRVALYAQRELATIATDPRSNDARWFAVMGDPPMREMFEKALGLPTAVGQLDIDRQLEIFKERAVSVMGSDDLDRFADDGARQDLITRFILRDQVGTLNGGMSSGALALALLQG